MNCKQCISGALEIFFFLQIRTDTLSKYRPRFFDQVGHQTTYASMHFQQKLDTFLESKVHTLKIKIDLLFFTEKQFRKIWFIFDAEK